MGYAIREAIAALSRAPLLVFVSIVSVALSLFVIGLFGLTVHNIRLALDRIEQRVEVVAYLRDSTTPEQVQIAEQELTTLPEVESIRYVSRAQALATAVQELPEFRDVYSTLDVNPLPASLEIRMEPGFRTPVAIERLAQHVLTYPFVEDAAFGREWVETIVTLRRIAGGATLIIGGAFAGVAGIIIATAVRIAVSARREEIEIMRLVGATDGFIRLPFLIEGFLAGITGGVLALVLTFLAYEVMRARLIELTWLPTSWILGALLFGTVYGFAASAVAVRRHLATT